MANTYLRHVKVKTSVVCLSRTTTTELKPTTDFSGSAIDVSGYRSGIFLHRNIANASGSPDVFVDGGMVTSGLTTTIWGIYATVQVDITTTASADAVFVEGLPDLIRIRLSNTTTTSSYRGQVSAKLFAN